MLVRALARDHATAEESHVGSMQLALRGDVATNGPEVSVGGIQKVVSDDLRDVSTAYEPTPDAACRGWVDPPEQSRIDALFVLAGLGLGIQRTDVVTTPVWLDLSEVEAMDALGDPQDGLVHVEIVMNDSTVVGAGWTESFCSAVVSALTAGTVSKPAAASDAEPALEPIADAASSHEDAPNVLGEVSPTEEAPATPNPYEPVLQVAPPVVRDRSRLAEAADEAETLLVAETAQAENLVPEFSAGETPQGEQQRGESLQDAVSPEAADEVPAADSSPGLELEDVVYLGGYPGQTKKRKNCTAVLTRAGLEVVGPADLRFRMSWDSVTSVEPQNSDEARFRMNTKIHRDSSALVIECDQGITLLLEARDCSTIPLRSAITQLLAGLPVLVV